MRSSRNSASSPRCSCACRGRSASRVRPRSARRGERDAAFGRLVEAGDAVEHSGLAGAVRADQRGDVAAARAVKDRSLTATRPPNRMVRCSTRSKVGPPVAPHPCPSLTKDPRRWPCAPWRTADGSRVRQAARLPDHDQHHGEAEDQHAVLRRIEVVAENVL